MSAAAPVNSSPPLPNSWRELNVRLGSIVTRLILFVGVLTLASLICLAFNRMGMLQKYFWDESPLKFRLLWASRYGLETVAVSVPLAAVWTLLNKKGRNSINILGILFLFLLLEVVVIGYSVTFASFGPQAVIRMS